MATSITIMGLADFGDEAGVGVGVGVNEGRIPSRRGVERKSILARTRPKGGLLKRRRVGIG